MLGLTGENLQVLGPVITLVAVDVMDDLAGMKRATKHLLSDESMLVAPATLAVGPALAPITELVGPPLGRLARNPEAGTASRTEAVAPLARLEPFATVVTDLRVHPALSEPCTAP